LLSKLAQEDGYWEMWIKSAHFPLDLNGIQQKRRIPRDWMSHQTLVI
jgi:hypothetical protein